MAMRVSYMKLFFKYMVSILWKMLVKPKLEKLRIHYTTNPVKILRTQG
jgi:hypothetical protein